MEDGPPVLLPSLFLDAFSIKIIRALASASSRVLQVIVPLSSSGASSSNTRIGSRLYQHQQALMSVIMCVTLYTGYMEMYALKSKSQEGDTRRIQVELAVAAKSAGACTQYACGCSGAAGMASCRLF
jgi:hypothetical protein